MLIIDAVSSAPTKHAVYFLVTGYIESLTHLERNAGIPDHVVGLPLRGHQDLAGRLELLKNHIKLPLEPIVPALELAGVLYVALRRLNSLALKQCACDSLLTAA